MQRSGVRLSVCPIIRPQQRRATAGLLLSAVQAGDIARQRQAPCSNGAAARGRSTALGSKCGQCHVDSRVDEAEHRLVALAVAKAVANTRSLHQGSRMAKKQNKTDMTERVSLIRMHNGRKVDNA